VERHSASIVEIGGGGGKLQSSPALADCRKKLIFGTRPLKAASVLLWRRGVPQAQNDGAAGILAQMDGRGTRPSVV